MKKHINEIIRQSDLDHKTKMITMVMTHFKQLGFELVKADDLKKLEKKLTNTEQQINELVDDNWQIAMKLYEAEQALGPECCMHMENTNIEAANSNTANSISTQAKTAGLRKGAEANDVELDAIINSLDSHIDRMTEVLQAADLAAELTRIKFELDVQDVLLDEQDSTTEYSNLISLNQIEQLQLQVANLEKSIFILKQINQNNPVAKGSTALVLDACENSNGLS